MILKEKYIIHKVITECLTVIHKVILEGGLRNINCVILSMADLLSTAMIEDLSGKNLLVLW
jgi:hypothetical protein